MEAQRSLVGAILRSPRIKNRLVVLCEGDLLPLEKGVTPSPQMYGRLEQMPDANFYKNCVGADWYNYRLPQFFNCGGRSQVLYVYRELLELHEKAPADSYLTPEKLYALVDLDLQPSQMPEGYPFQTTEAIHTALYQNGLIQGCPCDTHRIWVTALIHKEAFFVLPPGPAALVSDPATPPFYQGAPLRVEVLHQAIAQGLTTDGDLAQNLGVVADRLGRFNAGAALDCTDGGTLGTSFRAATAQANHDQYNDLVRALLAVAKVKPVWKEITPDPSWGTAMPAQNFRDQLALRVANAIAKTEPSPHPLSAFFA